MTDFISIETAGYYDQIAEEYARKNDSIIAVEELTNTFKNGLLGNKVLDVGCGPGRDAKFFSQSGLDVTGIDLSSGMLKLAADNVPKANFIRMDMRQLGFSAESFDGIWVCASLLCLPKETAAQALREFCRVLKGDGLLFVGAKKGMGETWLEEPQGRKFCAFYGKKELGCFISQAGFKLTRIICQKSNETSWINIFARKERN